MSDKGLYKTGLVFAVITAIGWLLFVVGSMTFPQVGELGSLERYFAVTDSSAALMYTWGGIFGALCAVPIFLAFFQGFRNDTGSVLVVPVVFAIIGSAFLALGFMVDSGSHIYYFGPAVAAAQGAEAETMLKAAQLAQDSIEVTWAIGSFLAYGSSILWMAILFLRSPLASKWLNWVGIIGSLAGFVWLLRFIPVPAPQSVGIILLFVNILGTMIWLIG